jgi:hypothetical protein
LVVGDNSLSTNYWKPRSNHFSLSILLSHISLIVPCSKEGFIHRNQLSIHYRQVSFSGAYETHAQM